MGQSMKIPVFNPCSRRPWPCLFSRWITRQPWPFSYDIASVYWCHSCLAVSFALSPGDSSKSWRSSYTPLLPANLNIAMRLNWSRQVGSRFDLNLCNMKIVPMLQWRPKQNKSLNNGLLAYRFMSEDDIMSSKISRNGLSLSGWSCFICFCES